MANRLAADPEVQQSLSREAALEKAMAASRDARDRAAQTQPPPTNTETTVAAPAWTPQTALERELDILVQTWLDGSRPEESLALIEDGPALVPSIQEGRDQHGTSVSRFRGRIDALTFESDDTAVIQYTILNTLSATGRIAKIDGRWMVTRDTECELLSKGGIVCPPRR